MTKVKLPEFERLISNFKDGISDAILRGEMIDATKPSEYKAGYDFGMTIYSDLIESGLIDGPGEQP